MRVDTHPAREDNFDEYLSIMTACNYLFLLLVGLIIFGGSARLEGSQDTGGDWTTASTSSTTTDTPATTTAKSAAHKSARHHKKKTAVATGTGTGPATGTPVTGKKTGTTTVATTGKGTAAGAETTVGEKMAGAKVTAVKTTGAVASTSPHKRHSKSHKTASAGLPKTNPLPIDSSAGPLTPYPSSSPPSMVHTTSVPETTSRSASETHTPITIDLPPPTIGTPRNGGGPEVDTGLPVARHSGNIGSDSDAYSRDAGYQIASAIPMPSTISSIDAYSTHTRVKNPIDNFTFTDLTRRYRNVYPWKINIITTLFWIGEGSTPISTTTNVASAWDEEWSHNNGGSDTPGENREQYMPAHHAARLNPFYVALPFNDLAFPDKARRWLPSGWYRPPRDRKEVSACKDRWVEIKSAQGRTCYAQWEDVGPLRYDHAEYVFGEERPDTYTSGGLDRAGLDASPAVYDYLGLNGKNCVTRWRFVDDADVVPGKWLQYDEEAVIFRAMHELKDDPTRVLPIEKAAAPIDDETDMDSVKKRIGAAKG